MRAADREGAAEDRDHAAERRDRDGDNRDHEGLERDQAGSRRDRVAHLRDQAGDDRDLAGEQRDQAGGRRDHAAQLRDRAAHVRDQLAELRDILAEQADLKVGDDIVTDARRRSSQARRDAHFDREQALHDRTAGAGERTDARVDRHTAHTDRAAGAGERANAGLDRETAQADRTAGAEERTGSGRDRGRAQSDRTASATDRDRALVDDVTGVYLRGPGLMELAREVARAQRTHEPLVVAFVDVDGLKTANDLHGHAAGDRLLRAVADTLRGSLRSYDVIIRYGGDEFVCVLAGLNQTEATKRLATINEILADGTEPATVTVGMAELQKGESLYDLVGRADAALYEQRRHRTRSRT